MDWLCDRLQFTSRIHFCDIYVLQHRPPWRGSSRLVHGQVQRRVSRIEPQGRNSFHLVNSASIWTCRTTKREFGRERHCPVPIRNPLTGRTSPPGGRSRQKQKPGQLQLRKRAQSRVNFRSGPATSFLLPVSCIRDPGGVLASGRYFSSTGCGGAGTPGYGARRGRGRLRQPRWPQ